MQGFAETKDLAINIAYDTLAINMRTMAVDQATLQFANQHDHVDTPGTGSNGGLPIAHASPPTVAMGAPPAAISVPPKAAPTMEAAPQASHQSFRGK